MIAGRLFCEAAGSAAPGATIGTFAVTFETGVGWLADAASAEEVIDIVHATVPRAREVWWSELLVWTEDDCRNRYRLRAPFPASRTRL